MSDNEELDDQIVDHHAEDDGDEAAAEGEGVEAAGLVAGEADDEDEAEYHDSSEVWELHLVVDEVGDVKVAHLCAGGR